jgi:cellulose synthase (UDP-forming)
VAFWGSINAIVLFLICMMSLQAPFRRAEERFELDEQIWIVGSAGMLSSGRIKDISLSGVAIVADRPISAKLGERMRVFIPEVGFIAGVVARPTETFIGIQFDLPPSVERDLLIRKLFTAGRDTANVTASAWSATGAMLRSIWDTRAELPTAAQQVETQSGAAPRAERLPACSLVVPPQQQAVRLSDLVEARRAIAA